jgi:hypothetical protein
MKFPLFRRKKFRQIYFILAGIIVAGSFLGLFLPVFFDFDNDSNLCSWIEEVSFTQKWEDNIDEAWYTTIEFYISLEIWNPGVFRIKTYSGHTALGFDHELVSDNSSFPIDYYYIQANDVGGLVTSSHRFKPGTREVFSIGYIDIVGNGTYPNPFLPDGNYTFVFGNEDWKARFEYNISVELGIETHFPSVKPENWGENPINLGNPYYYILPFIYISLFTTEIILNVKEYKKTTTNNEQLN